MYGSLSIKLNNLCSTAVPASSSCSTWYGLNRKQTPRGQYPFFLSCYRQWESSWCTCWWSGFGSNCVDLCSEESMDMLFAYVTEVDYFGYA